MSVVGPPTHVYLSTSCFHGRHAYCSALINPDTGQTKRPARCKFCAARCTCPCHNSNPSSPESPTAESPT